MLKNVPTSDTVIYTTGSGRAADVPLGAFAHNTTGSAITLTTMIQRSGTALGYGINAGIADATPYTIHSASIAANSQVGLIGGNVAALALNGGDRLLMRASASGLSVFGGYRERPNSGL
jgi:hypothetical protein